MASNTFSSLWKRKAGTAGILFSLFAICAVVLAACGGGAATGNTRSSSSASSVLTIVPSPIGDFSENFSPYSPTPSYGTQGMIYETLLYFNQETGQVTPWLAQSYQIASDAKSITFHLRPGVKWTDGQSFTSDDVVFTLNMLHQYPAADGNGLWQYISNVAAPDSSTVTVTLKMAYAPIIWYLGGQTWIVPKHLWSSVGDPTKYTDPQPVGTGPFTLKSFTPQLIDLVKNPNYWQPGKPLVTELRYPSFNSNTSAELLLSRNEVDWTGLYTPDIQQTFVAHDPAHNHYWFPPSNVVMLYLNLRKSPFNLLPVRKAISDVLDRQQMSTVGENGYEAVASPTGLVLPNNQSFLSSNFASTSFSINTSQAQQLMQSAGFTKDANGIYAQNGKEISFSIIAPTGWTDWDTDCQIIAKNLHDFGINATFDSIAETSYVNQLQMGTYQAAMSWTTPGPTPFYLYNWLLNSQQARPTGQLSPSNWEHWTDPATDKLLAQYATSSDSSVQQQALNGLQNIMVNQIPAIPLLYGATWYEYNSSRFTGWPDKSDPYAVPSPYTSPDSEVVVLHLKPA
jgi:peptide/nickel transport system substrate-binding protein